MPIKFETIPKSWEDFVMRKLGDVLRRINALERRSFAKQQQIFLYFSRDTSLPFTWQASRHSIVIEGALLDGTGVVTFTKNGVDATLPILADLGDRIVVTATGVTAGVGLGVTLTEDWPYP